MNANDMQAWLDRYVEAWRANAAGPIEELFSPDATYRYHPYDAAERTLQGRDAIVASWLDSPDDPATWEARYEPYAIDGDRAVAIGRSHYQPVGDDPDADGRCTEFTEYFMLEPRGA
jgi:hypothetical protein